jgi:hypothetical protein
MAFEGAPPEPAVQLDLTDLLIDIELGKVAVVVGRALLTTEDGGLLYQRLAAEIAADLSVPGDELPARPEIEDVAERFFARPFPANCTAGSLSEKLRNRLREAAIPRPLLDLAGVGPLGLFLSTTPDDLLFRALGEARAGVQHFTYAPTSLDSVPAAALREGSTLVCRLLGRADDPQQLALTEEDVLEHVRDLGLKLDPERGTQHDFAQVLRARQLLVIGCDFPDWLMRFFLRALRTRRFDPRLLPSARIAGVHGAGPLVLFLRRNGNLVYDLPPAAFVAELRRQWDRRRKVPSMPRRGSGPTSGRAPLALLTHGPEEDAIADPIADKLASWGISALRVRWPGDDLGAVATAEACAICLSPDPAKDLAARLAAEREAIEARAREAFREPRLLSLILRDWGKRPPPPWGRGANLLSAPAPDDAARRIVEPLLGQRRLDVELPVRLYCAAADEDAPHLRTFEKHLAGLKGWLRVWSPAQIAPGAEPLAERREQMAAAQIVALLVSQDLINGREEEIDAAFDRHQAGTALVVPILVRTSGWDSGKLGALAPLPDDQQPIAEQPFPDRAWTEAIRRLTILALDFVLGRAEGA